MCHNLQLVVENQSSNSPVFLSDDPAAGQLNVKLLRQMRTSRTGPLKDFTRRSQSKRRMAAVAGSPVWAARHSCKQPGLSGSPSELQGAS